MTHYILPRQTNTIIPQQINFMAKLEKYDGATVFFIAEKQRKSLNYSNTAGSLWFYSKDEATDFNDYIANTVDFKSFKYKAKLLGNTVGDGKRGILGNVTTTVPLKYLSRF